MRSKTTVASLATLIFLALPFAVIRAQEDPVLLDMTASDKIMPVPDTTEGYAVIFYTYEDGEGGPLSIRAAKLGPNGIESRRNTIAENVLPNSGEIAFSGPFEDTPANWYATWHRAQEQYLVVYATENGIFAQRVRESGAARGGPKKIMDNEFIDSLVVVQSGAKNYILFYKRDFTIYAQLLRKTGKGKGKPKAIAGGAFFGESMPLDAFCDSRTNAVLFYGTYGYLGDEVRFTAAMYRTNKSLNPIVHQAFGITAESKKYEGILAANSRDEEKYLALWPTKSFDLESGDADDTFGRLVYGRIASEDGENVILESNVSNGSELIGLATNPVTGVYWILYAYQEEGDGALTIGRVYLTNEPDSGGSEVIATLSNEIYGTGYGITQFGTHLVCYSYEEGAEDSQKKAMTYVRILN